MENIYMIMERVLSPNYIDVVIGDVEDAIVLSLSSSFMGCM